MPKAVLPKPVCIDFETHAIMPRPAYPPEPVSVSIKELGKKPKFFSWGHLAGGNNCSKADAARVLKKLWAQRHRVPLLFQNAKFDLDVAETFFDLPLPNEDEFEDSLFLIYLEDPRLKTFGLKPVAEKFLGMPPEEQDAVKDWLLQKDHKAWVEGHLGIDPKTGKRETMKPSTVGKFICYAPGDVVGPYADGDVIRTEKLFIKLWKRAAERGMLPSYLREKQVMPHLLASERQGQRVDTARLGRDLGLYHDTIELIDQRLRKKMKKPYLNVDSGAELAEAMVKAKLADDGLMGYTQSGKIQTNKAAIEAGVTDRETKALLAYRGPLTTCVRSFMEPWHATAQTSDGLIFTNWNQVRNSERGAAMGTSTGRLSSTPNFQNIPKEFSELLVMMMGLDPEPEKRTTAQIQRAKRQLAEIFVHVFGKPSKKFGKEFPALPTMRGYIVPYAADEVLIDRDYSQQELRLLGHFEGGVLMDAYLENQWLDMHEYARQLIKQITGRLYPRKPIKNTNFGIIYGQGAPSLAIKSGITVDESKTIIQSILAAFPGIQDIMDDMKDRAKADQPLRTWGGREYYCEEPAYSEKFKRVMTFDYKMINLLIQGSAADCTKEAIIRWCSVKPKEDRFYMTVHDQTVGSTPKKRLKPAMELMRQTMESIEVDVPLLTEGSYSFTDWAHMLDYDKAGKVVYHG